MTPEEIKRHRRLNFRQTNAFAMQYGAIMGLYVFAAEACFVLGLKDRRTHDATNLTHLGLSGGDHLVGVPLSQPSERRTSLLFWERFLLYAARCALFRNMGVVGRIDLLAIFRRRLLVPNISGGYQSPRHGESDARLGIDGAYPGVQRWTHPGTDPRTAAAYAGFRVCCHDTLFFHYHGPGILTRGRAFHHAWCP